MLLSSSENVWPILTLRALTIAAGRVIAGLRRSNWKGTALPCGGGYKHGGT